MTPAKPLDIQIPSKFSRFLKLSSLMTTYKYVRPICLGLRTLQILTALVLLIVACVNIVTTFDSHRIILVSIITGAISLCFYFPLVTPFVSFFPPIVVMFFEIMLTVWWIITFVNTKSYINDDCTQFRSDDRRTIACKTGKASFVVGIIGFVFSTLSLLLLVMFSLVGTFNNERVLGLRFFLLGGIVPKVATKSTETQPPIPHIESQRGGVGYDYENDTNCGNELQTLSSDGSLSENPRASEYPTTPENPFSDPTSRSSNG